MTADLSPNAVDLGPLADWLPQSSAIPVQRQADSPPQPDLEGSDLGDISSWLSDEADFSMSVPPAPSGQTSDFGSLSEWLGNSPVPEQAPLSRYRPLPKDLLAGSEVSRESPPPEAPSAEVVKGIGDYIVNFLKVNWKNILSGTLGFGTIGSLVGTAAYLGRQDIALLATIIPPSIVYMGGLVGHLGTYIEVGRERKLQTKFSGEQLKDKMKLWEGLGNFSRWIQTLCANETTRSFAIGGTIGAGAGVIGGVLTRFGVEYAHAQSAAQQQLLQPPVSPPVSEPQPQPLRPGVLGTPIIPGEKVTGVVQQPPVQSVQPLRPGVLGEPLEPSIKALAGGGGATEIQTVLTNLAAEPAHNVVANNTYWSIAYKWSDPIANSLKLSEQAHLYLTDAIKDVISHTAIQPGQTVNVQDFKQQIIDHINASYAHDNVLIGSNRVHESIRGMTTDELTKIKDEFAATWAAQP